MLVNLSYYKIKCFKMLSVKYFKNIFCKLILNKIKKNGWIYLTFCFFAVFKFYYGLN